MTFPLLLGVEFLAGGGDTAEAQDDTVPVPETVVVSGWETLGAIARENAQHRADAATGRPVACWCGWPLQDAPDGGLFCPADGTRF